ncbi:MAG: hypothetical protein WCP21_20265 [Armatimonadota bacterium]
MAHNCKTLALLNEPGPPKLLVSLPGNDPDLAKAARDGGAAALKVHLNITHAAAGLHFGTLAEEAAAIETILALGLPVGIVPGDAGAMVTPGELTQLAAMGIDFCDVYLGAMPAWMLSAPPLAMMAAVGSADFLHAERLRSLGELASVAMVEASLVAHDGYGAPLSVADLCDYTTVTRLIGPSRPVIVPTQRRILPDDLPALAATGIRGLLIGAIVTGKSCTAIEAATRRYAEALGQISGDHCIPRHQRGERL